MPSKQHRDPGHSQSERDVTRTPKQRRRAAWHGRAAWRTVRNGARRLIGKLPLPDEDRESIDFSAPSVPYYTDLSRRFRLAQLILYVVLFVFLVAAVLGSRERITYANLYYLVKDINAASHMAEEAADQLDYSISTVSPAMTRYRGGLVIVGDNEVTVLSGSGRQTLHAQVNYATPAVAASEKYFLTYGRGETSFSLFNAFTRIHSETTEYPVYGAAVADDGSFILLTRSAKYTSRVVFYDRFCKVRASYYLTGYALSVTVSPSGDFAAVSSVEDVNGHMTSKVNLFRLTGTISNETVTVENTLASLCAFTAADRVAIVCPDRLIVLRTDASVQADIRLEGNEPDLCTVFSGRIALLKKNSLQNGEKSGTATIRVLDKNGKDVYTADVKTDAEPTALAFGGNVLYVRANGYLYRLSGDGRVVTETRIRRDTLAILPDGNGSVLVCSPAYASRYYTRDFTDT